MRKAGIPGIIIGFGYAKDVPKKMLDTTQIEPMFIYYHAKQMMEDPETSGEIVMRCAHCFKMRNPNPKKKGYWVVKGKNGYDRPFYGFALIPQKDDENTGRKTAEAFIAKLNDTEDENVKDVVKQYNMPPQFRLESITTVPMGKGKSYPAKMMAVDDIIHLWRAMGMDPTMLLEKDDITERFGQSIINCFFNNSTAKTIKDIRNINNKIKEKEQHATF